MVRVERRPAWQIDLKWWSAILLVITVAVGALAHGAARLTAPERSEPLVREIMRLVIGPSGGPIELAASARGYVPGEPLAVLPGLDVYVDPSEVPAFSPDDAVSRAAGVLSQRFLFGGAAAALSGVTDPTLRGVLERVGSEVVQPLVNAGLQRALLPVGLDDGSRAANWPAQAAQNPGQEVQPLVGIFVTAPPTELTGRTPRQIGERVIDGLAEVVYEDGAAAALELVTNPNVSAALQGAVDGPVWADLHAAFESVLSAYHGEIVARLEDARAVHQGDAAPDDPWAGVVDEAEVAALSPADAEERALQVLALRTVASGASGVLELLQDPGARDRVASAAPLLDAVSRSASARYRTWSILAGVLALLAAAVLVATASGTGRVWWPGLALVIAAAPGWALARVWRGVEPVGAYPAGPAVDGAMASVWRTGRLIASSLAPAAAETVGTIYLAVLGVGASLLLIAVAAWLARWLRPRRRGLL